MGEIRMEITIPADNDGYVLLKCPLCGEYFKLMPAEMQSDDVIEIYCPCCGLKSDSYLTEDAIELAQAMIKNAATAMIFDSMKKLERQIKGKGVSFQAGKRPQSEHESPLVASIEAMEVQNYKCCQRAAKIKPLIRLCGSYCPYCGVKYDES